MSLLYNLNESTVVEKVTMKWPSDEYVIPAGTPMSRTGIANDKNAIGILANEAKIKFHYPLSVAKHIGKEEPKGKQDYTFSIITSGFVNLTDAEASFGAKISEEAKSAMGEINFVNETEPASFGGGGGSNILEAVGSDTLTWDGDTSGLESCEYMEGIFFYHVSDVVPTLQDFANGVTIGACNGSEVQYETISGGDIRQDDKIIWYGNSMSWVVSTEDNVSFGDGILNKGVYLLSMPEYGVYYCSLTINGYTGFTKEQIKEEYIPDSLKGGGGSGGSAGGGVMIFKVEVGENTTSEKTYDELAEAIENNILPVCKLVEGYSHSWLYLEDHYQYPGENCMTFFNAYFRHIVTIDTNGVTMEAGGAE